MANTDSILSKYAAAYGLDPAMLRAFRKIESGGDLNARTGSYAGLFQLSPTEFEKYGGGDIYNPEDNTRAAAAKLAAEKQAFQRQYGREPSAHDLYLIHQQGEAGYAAHTGNPGGVAWQNVRPYYTDEAARRKGFADGDAYAKAAIWGNVPDDVKAKYGSVENMTSQDFTKLWQGKVSRAAGEPAAPGQAQGQESQEMLPLFAMLAQNGATMGGLGATAPAVAGTVPSAAGGGLGSIFGSLNGGKGLGGESMASGGTDALAANAMKAASGDAESALPRSGTRPIDMSQLTAMLKNAGYLGTSLPRRT